MTTTARVEEGRAMSNAGGAEETWYRWMRFLARYHASEVVGANNVPRTGGAIFAGTHSLASYELFIAAYAADHFFGRKVYIIGDALMFKLPGLSKSLREIGFIAGTREELVQRLKDGDMLGIAPGGMKESLRTSKHRYEFDWSSRRGFAAVAMQAGVPVVPTACPQADLIYTVHENPITPWVFRNFKVPAPIVTGRWFSVLPRPVKLVHLVGKPIYPDVAPDQAKDEDVKRFQERIIESVRGLVEEGKRMGDRPSGDDVRSVV
jgi:1-acyl-sn-glycerol-3-phosphate acyltransferase